METFTARARAAWFAPASRVRGLATGLGVLAIAAAVLAGLALPEAWFPAGLQFGLIAAGFGLVVVALALTLLPVVPGGTPRPVAPPVQGRWVALNSPAGKVPSHGTHGHGQTYAIDLVYEPEPPAPARPRSGEGSGFRPPGDYPGFGQPVYAVADATVVSVHDGARDHRGRSSLPAFAYLLVEGALRDVIGSRFLLGNHVVLDLGDGVYAAYAHLQRRSVVVRPGQRLRHGELIGRCGNSGNTTEPHLHFQLMDHRWAYVAAGLPFTFTAVRGRGEPGEGHLPGNGDVLEY